MNENALSSLEKRIQKANEVARKAKEKAKILEQKKEQEELKILKSNIKKIRHSILNLAKIDIGESGDSFEDFEQKLKVLLKQNDEIRNTNSVQPNNSPYQDKARAFENGLFETKG